MKHFLLAFVLAIGLSAQTRGLPILQANVYTITAPTGLTNALKLDTRTGQVWQIRWYSDSAVVDSTTRWQKPVNALALADTNSCGRFAIFGNGGLSMAPTFMLLDQVDGRVWLIVLGRDGIYTFTAVPEVL